MDDDDDDDDKLEQLLTEEQTIDFKEAFKVFDRDKDGKITTLELGTVMRALGQYAPLEEVEEMFNMYDREGTGFIEEIHFLKIMGNRMQYFDQGELIVEAFKVFDAEGRGIILVEDFRRIMRNLGDRLSEEEIKLIIKDSEPDPKGFIRYQLFVDKLTPKKKKEKKKK